MTMLRASTISLGLFISFIQIFVANQSNGEASGYLDPHSNFSLYILFSYFALGDLTLTPAHLESILYSSASMWVTRLFPLTFFEILHK